MHRLSILFAAAFAGVTVLHGQQTPQAPVFRSGTALVRVDVTVLDPAGKPVPGLNADDFEIRFDGRVQRVQTVDYQSAPKTQAVSAVSQRQATNAAPVSDSRLVVVLVDDLSMSPTNSRDLFHAASQFVASLPESDLVGLTTSSGEAAVNPTRDHAAVEVALRRGVGTFNDPRSLPPDKTVGLNEALEIDGGNTSQFTRVVERECLEGRAARPQDLRSTCADEVERKARQIASLMQRASEMQLASYRSVINAMRPVESEKALVILSAGVMSARHGPRQGEDFSALERQAATAGVRLSILYPEPDAVSMSVRSADEAKVLRDDGKALEQGLQNIAGATGADFYRVIGQPERFFGFVADGMSAVYHLGVEAPPGSAPGQVFKLSARVKRPGVTVRANRVALREAPAAPVSVADQLQAVVTRGEVKYGVPVAVGAVIRPGKTADEIALGVNVEIPAGVPGPLTMRFSVVDATGKSRTGGHTLSARDGEGNYRLSFSLPLPAASYRLRIAIADAQGQVGGVDLPVKAQMNRVGPLNASDIQVAWSGADGKPQFVSLGKVPAAASSLLMGLELTPASGAMPPTGVRVMWTIVTEAGQAVAEQTVAAVPTENRLNAQTRASIASLPAGTYELRATILIGDQAAGVASVTFRRAGKQIDDPQ